MKLATIIANKATVGLAYADAGLEGDDFSLASVTEVASTVTAANVEVATLASEAAAAAAETIANNPDSTIAELNAANAAAAAAAVVAAAQVIVDNATEQTFTVAAASSGVIEGNAIVFTVTADHARDVDTIVNYQIQGVAVAGGTATPVADLGILNGTVTVLAGSKTATFTLTPTNDQVTEGIEGFKVVLLNSSFATIASSQNVVISDAANSGQTFSLTNDTDTTTANIFDAGLVYTPGGNDRINSLQDEDTLTGTGTNPTLNATIGNQNDNGAMIITPTLNGIETINAAMSHTTAGMGLDLQDATGLETVNVTRISTAGSDVQNMQGSVTTLSASNTQAVANVSFTYINGELTGTQEVDLTLANVNANTLTVGAEAILSQQAETLNLNVTSASSAMALDMRSDGLATTSQTLNIDAASEFILGNDLDQDGDYIEHNIGLGSNTAGADGILGTADDVEAAVIAGIKNINVLGAGNVTLGAVGSANDFALDGSTSTGNIAVNITNSQADDLSTFVTGSGADTVLAAGSLAGDVTTNDGADTVTVGSLLATSAVDLGEGNDTMTVGTSALNAQNVTVLTGQLAGTVDGGATVNTGNGDDVLALGDVGNVSIGEEAVVNMGEGNDTATLTGSITGDTGIGDTLGGELNMGEGDNTVTFNLLGQTNQGTLVDGLVTAGTGADTMTVTGNANATIATADTTDADRITGFETLNLISTQSYSLATAAAINAVVAGVVEQNDNDSLTADYTVRVSEFTGLTAINIENQAGMTNTAPEEATGTIFAGDSATYNIQELEGQAISLTTVETGSDLGLRSVGVLATAAEATITADQTADAILNVGMANGTVGVADSATDTLTLTIAGEGDVAINDTAAGVALDGTNDFENLALTVNGTADRSVILAATDFETTMTVDGDTTGTITFTNVEATTFTSTIAGNVNATMLTSENKTITTGDGDDIIDLQADIVDINDTIDLGAGTNRIVIANDLTSLNTDAGENFRNISNVQEIQVAATDATATGILTAATDINLDNDAQAAGVSKIIVDAAVAADVVTANGFTNALTVDMTAATVGVVSTAFTMTNAVNVNTTYNINTVDATALTTLALTNVGSGTQAINITVDDVAQTISATAAAVNDVRITNASLTNEIDTITLLDSNTAVALPPLAVGGDQTGAITLTVSASWAQAGDTLTINASDINDDDRIDTGTGLLVNTDNQTVVINGAAANYKLNITGSEVNDTITGGLDSDTINAGAGNDTITGAAGADTLTGGTGADTFIYTAVAESNYNTALTIDTITDFETGTDTLSIAISGATVNAGQFNTAATIGNGLGTLNGTIGDYFYSTDGYLAVDTDGNNIINNLDYAIKTSEAIAASDVNFTITGTAGADLIRGGQGADNINTNDASVDSIVLVGEITSADATAYLAAGAPILAGNGAVLTLAELTTVRTTSEVKAGEKITADATDSLHVYGTVNLALVDLTAFLGTLVVHSNVTMTEAQFIALGAIVFDGNEPHTLVVVGDGTTAPVGTALTAAEIATLAIPPLSVTNGGASTSFTIGGTTATTLTGVNAALVYDLEDTVSALTADTVATLDGATTITTTDTTVDAGDLVALDLLTTVAIGAASVTTLTGTATDIGAAYDANAATTITGLGNEAVTVSGTNTAVNVDAINDATSGIVTATVTADAAATLDAALVDSGAQVNALTITLNDVTVAVADLTSLDAKTTVAVDATTVTTVTGAAADVNTAYASAGIANLSATAAVTLDDVTLAASVLNTLDGNTSGTIDAATVTTLTGTATVVDTALTSAGISNLGNEAVTLTDATLAATTLNTLDLHTSGAIDATTLTALNGSAAAIASAYGSGGITGMGDENLTLTDSTLAASAVNTLDSETVGTITTVGGTLSITGLDGVTIAATAAADTFVLLNGDSGVTVSAFDHATDTISLDGGIGAVTALDVASIDGSETLVFDTIGALGALGVTIGDQSGGSAVNWAVASDTGAIFYDADGDWSAGSMQVATIGVVAAGLDATDFLL